MGRLKPPSITPPTRAWGQRVALFQRPHRHHQIPDLVAGSDIVVVIAAPLVAHPPDVGGVLSGRLERTKVVLHGAVYVVRDVV